MNKELKFSIDRRYIGWLSLEAIVGYLLGIILVFCFFKPQDPIGFVGASLIACIVIFFIFMFPRTVVVKNGIISFMAPNSCKKRKIKLNDVISVTEYRSLYNTVMIKTKNGETFKFHPKDALALVETIK